MPSWHCHLKYSNLCVHHPETAKLLTAPLLSDLWAWSVSDSQPTSTQICQPASPMPGWLPGVSQRKRAHSPDSFDSVPPAVAEWAVHCDGSNATAQIVATNKKKLKCYWLPWKDRCSGFLTPFWLRFGGRWSPLESQQQCSYFAKSGLRTSRQNSLSQCGYHHHLPMGARRESLHGPSSPKQGIMTVSDLQILGLMGDSRRKLQTWLIKTFSQEQISMWPITDIQIIWNIRKVETCDVRKDEI